MSRFCAAALAVTAMLAAPALSGCRSSCTSPMAAPDVYVVIIDSLRTDHLGAYGYIHPTSPELDAWSQGAVVFDRAYTVAPWTLPTVATVMTGHHPYAVGIREEQTAAPASVTTLGELFKDNGYATGAVVSHIYLLPKYGLMQGMDFVDEDMVEGHHEIISSDGVTDRALGYLKEHVDQRSEQPLFMVTHYFDPHYDYILHPELFDTWPDYDGPLTSGMPVKDMRKVLGGHSGQELEDDRRSLSNLYDSEIRYTDHHVGRLLDGIAEAGRADNAIIVVLGDHGEELGERGTKWIGHTKVVSEEVLRVPLMVRLPHGQQPRQRVSEVVSLVDLMPTIMAQARLTAPDDLKLWGQPLDMASSDTYRDTVHAETGRWARIQVSIRDKWKLVSYPQSRRPRVELYDLSTDPGERRNVARQNPELLTELEADLAAWNTALEADRKWLDPQEEEPTLTKEEEEALRAMGYIE